MTAVSKKIPLRMGTLRVTSQKSWRGRGCSGRCSSPSATHYARSTDRLVQFFRFSIQWLVEGFRYASAHRLLELISSFSYTIFYDMVYCLLLNGVSLPHSTRYPQTMSFIYSFSNNNPYCNVRHPLEYRFDYLTIIISFGLQSGFMHSTAVSESMLYSYVTPYNFGIGRNSFKVFSLFLFEGVVKIFSDPGYKIWENQVL